MLELRNIAKHYGKTAVLRDISATIAAGERVGIRGRNGAGKTTLFRILSRSVRPDAGSAMFHGVDLLQCGVAELRGLGVSDVTQQPRLVRSLSVADNIRMGTYFVRQGTLGALLPDTNGDISTVLNAIGSSHLVTRSIGTLTAYEIRLVELARALSPVPKLLLLDEPAAGLTPGEKRHIVDALRSPVLRNTALVVIEHDQRFLDELCSRVLRLVDGTFEAADPTT